MSQSKSSIVLKNTLSNYFRQIVTVIVFLLLTPFVASKLGTEKYGLWSLLWSTVALLSLFDLGFSPAVVKYIATARGQEDNQKVGGLTATFFWIHMLMGTVALVVACLITPFLGILLKLPQELTYPAQMTFLILSFRVAQSLPFGLFASILVSFQKEAWANTVKALGTIIYGIVVYLVFQTQASVVNIAVINLGSAILANSAIVMLAVFFFPQIHFSPKWFDKKLVKEITSFSIYAIILYASKLLYTRVDSIIIKLFSVLEKVAFYNVAVQTVESAQQLTGQLNRALTPMIAQLSGAGDEKGIREILIKGSKISFALAAPLLIGLLWLTEPLLMFWMGEKFRETILPMQILIGSAVAATLADGARNILIMTGYHKFLTKASVAAQIVNITLTIVLILKFDLPGVAIATFISVIILDFAMIAKVCNLHSVKVSTFFIHTLLPSVLPLLIMLLTLYGLNYSYTPSGLLSIALSEIVACIVFFLTFYLFGLKREEKKYYTSRILKLFRR